MAIVTSNEYDHIDVVNGSNTNRHYIKDTTARNNIEDLKSIITEQTVNLIRGRLTGVSIADNGTFAVNQAYDMVYAPVTSGVKYTVITDDASGLVCGFFANAPTTSSTAVSGRIIQTSKTIQATATGYIAFRVTAGYPYSQVVEGDTQKEYTPPLSAKDIIIRDAISLNGNVFNPSGVVEGKYVIGNNRQTPIVNSDPTNCYFKCPIKGIGGKLSISTVNFPAKFGANVGFIGQDDITQPVIWKITEKNGTWSGTWTNQDGMYLYINCTMADKDRFAVYINQQIDKFVPYGETIAKITNMNSPIYGKKLCVNGDSVMYGAGNTGGFAKIIADEYNMVLQNIAVSGGTIASGTVDGNGNNRYWIAAGMANLANDGDYYIIDGGLNDYNVNVPLFPDGQTEPRKDIDTTYPSDLTSFSEAMEALCYDLIVNHTGKKFGFVFTHKNNWYDWGNNSLGYNHLKYKDVQKTILKKWGVPFIDISEISGMDTIFPAIAEAYTANADKSHPNEAGYKIFYVPHIVKWMESL